MFGFDSTADLLKDLHQDGDQACINHFLNLAALAGSDVGHRPGRFFLDAGFVVSQQAREDCQGTCVQHTLGLLIGSSHDVANRSQGRCLSRGTKSEGIIAVTETKQQTTFLSIPLY